MNGGGKIPYRLDLARINLNDPNASRNQLLPQRIRKTAHSRLGSTVNTAAGVGLPAGDGADIDDVSGTAIGPLLEDGQDGLRDVDQAGDVGREHDVDVLLGDLGCFRDTLDETTTQCHINVSVIFILILLFCSSKPAYSDSKRMVEKGRR